MLTALTTYELDTDDALIVAQLELQYTARPGRPSTFERAPESPEVTVREIAVVSVAGPATHEEVASAAWRSHLSNPERFEGLCLRGFCSC